MPGKARYYFVWPHPAGTMVGTTEREVNELVPDPLPSRDEIEEILGRVERDIPGAGLSRDNACYAFAGIRTLPLRGKGANSSVLSRKHIWSHEDGVLTLVGGKYTTASWTALEGVKMATRLLKAPVSRHAIKARGDLKKLPSCMTPSEEATIDKTLATLNIGPETRSRLIGRYGKRLTSRYLQGLTPEPEKVIAMEARIALETEQVESLEDLMRRRLELEYVEGHGERYLPVLREVFKAVRPEIAFDRESSLYLTRMTRISKLLGKL
jgi:glycerol-3-phosphate dehydrogenase